VLVSRNTRRWQVYVLYNFWVSFSRYDAQCTVFVVCNPAMTPNVQSWRYLTTLRYVYVICHFWTPVCNVLGYWWHRSVCYTSLFTTSLVVTTISVYSVLWLSDVVSRSGSLISSVICSVISFGVFISVSLLSLSHLGVSSISVSLYLGVSSISSFSICLSYFSVPVSDLLPLKYSDCTWNSRHLLSWLYFPLLRFHNSLVA
jgi:hypothetical protein